MKGWDFGVEGLGHDLPGVMGCGVWCFDLGFLVSVMILVLGVLTSDFGYLS